MRVAIATTVYNEGSKIAAVVRRVLAALPCIRRRWPDSEFEMVIFDDGSTDGAAEAVSRDYPVRVFRDGENRGVGRALRFLVGWLRENRWDVLVCLAGNNKDEPREIPRLLAPILERGFDFIQGSRYRSGGRSGNTPLYRQIATRFVHPFVFTLCAGRRMTDTTNGFRAIRLSIFDDPRIRIDQPWLDRYELEPYILYKAIALGYKVREVPVTKVYPPHELGYTKMRPFTDWWSILRPLVYLRTGFRR